LSGERARILIVDDDPDLLRLMAIRLRSAGYETVTAASGEQALAQVMAAPPRLVVTDLRMGGMDGMALFDAIRETRPTLPVIVLTAHGTIPDAVAATQRGVFGYLTKPFEASELMAQIERALKLGGHAVQDDSTGTDADWRREIITHSARMNEVLARAQLAAASDASVLIYGESGTGKELLARALVRAGARQSKPFVAINCGAIPEQLLESELFGHVRGAFTGAVKDHNGLFQAADGGTLFLDEIGDMPVALQVKLLRVLQEGEVRPLGSTRNVAVNVRIIAATHRRLDEEMAAGRFREDLYYRLNVVSIEVPALAERREDIPLLAAHFLKELADKYQKAVNGFAPDALEVLLGAAWPGNVRQLRNVIEQAVALCQTPLITADWVQQAIREQSQGLASFDEARGRFEREYLAQLLKIAAGNVAQAARLAKRNRTEFYKLLRRHTLDPALFKLQRPGQSGDRPPDSAE
jgi:two-component system, NtrC family, response regulator GlrR